MIDTLPVAQSVQTFEESIKEKHVVTLKNDNSHLNIRSGAGVSNSVIGNLKNGSEVEVLAEEGNWYKIRTEDGLEGYVSKDYLIEKIIRNVRDIK